ncbi:uncharacterized protein MKK02DRAFT_38454 [Dioszegia hungarica]|uniref:Ser-Thr-rich glycosyl-phosphatidyl-inositol-anchored membrane family-domain-containing protein n=1 Tax=Dioszegia hungarica TaxID=4972 RepID=A0AA38LS52_9TREE|nr:uncharacterized protein MKK02DRAFT_38454 [Dioszegia hungarica]KAI9633795.1 hypothetical protein MKK02DRAFT_38454 [Dioszegia hungarica]
MLFAVLPLLFLATSAHAALSILYPNTNTVWYKNNTVALNWTATNPSTDTYFFRTFLGNSDSGLLATNQSLADQTNATASYVRVLLPGVPSGGGYVVYFVNSTNESQVFATSQPFRIEDGIVATSTTPPSSQTASPSSNNNIPNAQSNTANPFASSSRAAAMGLKPNYDSLSSLLAQGAAVMLCVGAGVGMLV